MVEKGEAALLNWVLIARSAPGCMSWVGLGKVLLRIMLSMPGADMSKAKSSMEPPLGSPKFIMDMLRVGLVICMGGCWCGCWVCRAYTGMLRRRFALSFCETMSSSDCP